MLTLGYMGWAALVQNAYSAEKSPRELCPGFVVKGTGDISLTDTERRLVCGDKDGKGPNAEAWSTIPFPEAKYFFETFLQDRGYFQSKLSEENGKVVIVLGPITRVTAIDVVGGPSDLEIGRKREVVGEVLTPRLLDVLEQWTVQRLQEIGYPCPRVKTQAAPESGIIQLRVDAGFVLPISRILEEPIVGLNPGTLRRYDAFRLGDRFNGHNITVTSSRILGDGVVQSVHFGVECLDPVKALASGLPAGATLKQETIPGLPRLLSFGFGVDTEGVLLLKGSWKNTRLGPTGSLVSISAFASSKQQRINANWNWYSLPYPSRRYMRPAIEFKRDNEQPYETLSTQTEVAFATSYDNSLLGLGLRTGPAYELVKTVRGSGPPVAHLVALDSEVRISNHDHEFYRGSPRTGFEAVFGGYFTAKGVLSDLSAQKLTLSGQSLWNFRDYDPPLWVVGFRYGLATTLTGERPGEHTGLPPTFRNYMGGSGDLRGFGRLELPANGLGGLSLAFASWEARFGGKLPLGLEPFGFLDTGALGYDPLSLGRPFYWSPGFGIRYPSPIGVIRTTLAHGFLAGMSGTEYSHWQFYFNFGEEF